MPLAQMKFNFFVDIYIKCDIIKLQVERKEKQPAVFRNEKKIKVGTNWRRRNNYDTDS